MATSHHNNKQTNKHGQRPGLAGICDGKSLVVAVHIIVFMFARGGSWMNLWKKQQKNKALNIIRKGVLSLTRSRECRLEPDAVAVTAMHAHITAALFRSIKYLNSDFLVIPPFGEGGGGYFVECRIDQK